MMTQFRTLSFAALIGVSLLAGCSAFEGDNDRSDRNRDRDRTGDYDRDTRTAGGNVDRDSGTSNRVPRDARVVDEGRGGAGASLRYSADSDGTVYLVDSSAGVVVWDQRVRDRDRVEVTPGANRITVNGKEAANIDLKKNDRFQLYFLDGSRR
jgi:hypothetical protein